MSLLPCTEDINGKLEAEEIFPNLDDPVFESIRQQFKGQLLEDDLSRMIYANDASVYQQTPMAVACPRDGEDVRLLIQLANEKRIGLIPRAAGTSLAGQVVGEGIVVDVSRFMNQVVELNAQERWVRVQPGLVRDHLNAFLVEHELFFGPETSTSNRATLGGMLGNNSCGANSIVYGGVRDQIISVSGFFADGSFATLNERSVESIAGERSFGSGLEKVLGKTLELIQQPGIANAIRTHFPKPEISRRNTGYAIDKLLDTIEDRGSINLSHLVAGSEGTLFFATELKIRCHPLPPRESLLFCPHFDSVDQALRANTKVSKYIRQTNDSHNRIYSCELIDRYVLDGAARNLAQARALEFLEGRPGAVLLIEFRGNELDSVHDATQRLRCELQSENLGYAWPTFSGEQSRKIWDLRKAGLGVVANVKGPVKPVTVIEDAAVAVQDLPEFIREVNQLLQEMDLQCVHYGHAGAGELHLRPLLDLSQQSDIQKFKHLSARFAEIVKCHGGSLSGEHGDGRLRGQLLRFMIGDDNYRLIQQLKQTWDPNQVFNPGKIINVPSLTSNLRCDTDPSVKPTATEFHFREEGGLLAAAELCSGSGDCRKTQLSGGVMCPSYMVTKEEKDTTRGRANVLRQVLSGRNENGMADEQVKEAMDLCLACKGCRSECPSNVDVAKMKAEFLQAWHDRHGTSRRARRLASFSDSMELAARWPRLSGWLTRNRLASAMLKRHLNVHSRRHLPSFYGTTLRRWAKDRVEHEHAGSNGSVFLFADEFSNFVDVEVGIAAIELLERLGFRVELPSHKESGRVLLSQGFVRKAKAIAEENVRTLSSALRRYDTVLVGIEPSALLTLRDEYPDLVESELVSAANELASRSVLIDEFVSDLIDKQGVSSSSFNTESRTVYVHGHCHQKALSSMRATMRMLGLPRHYSVKNIPSGCCGMAGSFGFEKEHYDLSMRIGELVLFPAIRSLGNAATIAAGGTSCRQQIMEGTARRAQHPVEILRDAWLES